MNIATLDAIVDNSFFVDDSVKLGNAKAKQLLGECLPIERHLFEDLARDEATDFMKGYDDKYPRVKFDVVQNSTKMIGNVEVPAFAIYGVFDRSAVCQRVFSICSNNYNCEPELNKKMVPHNKLLMRLYEHVWDHYTAGDGVFFGFVGIVLQCSLFMLMKHTVFYNVAAWTGSALGILFFAYAVVIGNRASSSLTITRSFTHKFDGVIPTDVRNLIISERDNYDNFFIVEESYDWKTDDSRVTQAKNPNPLIIGRKSDRYYLLAKFDVTPLENLIATEFSA